MTVQTEISVFDPAKCFVCCNPPPENHHAHRMEGNVQHVACDPCVERWLASKISNGESTFCPENCNYDFSPGLTWKNKACAFLKKAVKNPVVILAASGASATGLNALIDPKLTIVVLAICSALSCGKFFRDMCQDVQSLALPVFTGFMASGAGIAVAPLSESGFPIPMLLGVAAGVCSFMATVQTSQDLDQPISYQYKMPIHVLTSSLFLGNGLLARARPDIIGAATGTALGISGLLNLIVSRTRSC
jgi:hypothetical protein